jgi:hypothetical protein
MWTKVKAVAASIWTDVVDTYKRTKVFLLGILALVVYIEWQKIKTTWLVKSGQAEVKSDNKQDASLTKTEQVDNQQAEALVAQANQLPSTEQPVTEDWYKKD